MLDAYLAAIATRLDNDGRHVTADVVDSIRVAQAPVMPDSLGASYDKGHNAAQEVQKLATYQASLLKNLEAELNELKAMKTGISRGARDFWRFRRSKYQQPAVQQPQVTDMNAFGLRAAPAPQLRKSQNELRFAQSAQIAPAVAPARLSPGPNVMPLEDEVEEFFQWLEAEQAKKLQNGNNMFGGGNMNLPFQIG